MESMVLFECCLDIVDETIPKAQAGNYWIENVSTEEISAVHYNSISQANQELLLRVLHILELNIDFFVNYQAVNDISTILPMNNSHIAWFVSLKKAKESMVTHSNWIELYFDIISSFQNLQNVRLDVSDEQLKCEIRFVYVSLINKIFLKRLSSFGINEFSFREKLLSNERINSENVQLILIN
jgi:hypothetical protein